MDRNEYYNHEEVLYEIVKILKGRETTFLGSDKAWRCIKAHSVNFLKSNMKAFNFDKFPMNIYYSLASLYNMPMFSYNAKKRKIEQTEFNKKFKEYITGYDIGFDFDSHYTEEGIKKNYPLEIVYNDCKKLKEVFDQYEVPYTLKFSGSGFHININNHVFPEVKDKLDLYKRLIDRCKIIFNLKTLDNAVTDLRRIWKCPYSYDYKTGNIALPLTDRQFKEFKIEMVKPEEVIKKGIRNRGIIERKGNNINFIDFLNDFMLGDEDLII